MDNETTGNDLQMNELTVLKDRATKLGINFHPSIGLDKLREKINSTLNDESEKETITSSEPKGKTTAQKIIPNNIKPSEIVKRVESKLERQNRLRKEAAKLIRIRVTCMNPSMRDHEGMMYSVSNGVVGTFKKYVPFNNEEGWHVPAIILKHMRERKCQVFQTVKNERGMKVRKGKLINELSIEILDPLDESELKDLAVQQAMANNLD